MYFRLKIYSPKKTFVFTYQVSAPLDCMKKSNKKRNLPENNDWSLTSVSSSQKEPVQTPDTLQNFNQLKH